MNVICVEQASYNYVCNKEKDRKPIKRQLDQSLCTGTVELQKNKHLGNGFLRIWDEKLMVKRRGVDQKRHGITQRGKILKVKGQTRLEAKKGCAK